MSQNNQKQIRKAPSNALCFVPLGGTGEIGMNLNLYGCDGKWLAVDMGVTFGDDSVPGVDVVMADHIFLEENADNLVGIVITHAHEDHIGAVALMWPDLRVPVYCTPFAAAFLRHKLKEEGLEREVPVNVIPLGGRFQAGPFDIEYVPMNHSIPEACMLAIRTPHGTVVHTGDWKIDPEPVVGPAASLARLKEIGDEGVMACISDSTNVLNPGHSGSEGDVARSLVDVFAQYGGRLAICCFASNVARLESIFRAAKANNRQICLVGRSLWRIADVARESGYFKDAPILMEAEQAANLAGNKVLYVCTGSQGEVRAAMARIAWGNHPYVKFGKGDAVLFSSRVIPGNEKSIYRLQNQLVRNGVEIQTDRDRFIHVSGHPAKEEVKELYSLIRPQTVIPVHGEARHLQEHADFALNCGAEFSEVLTDGDVVELGANGPQVIGQVQIGRLTVDGERIVPLDSPILKDRKRMVINGAAVVTVVLSEGGKVVQDPLVTVHGLFNPEDDEDGPSLSGIVRAAIERLSVKDRRDDDIVIEAARRVLRRTFFDDQNRKPLTDVHLVRV